MKKLLLLVVMPTVICAIDLPFTTKNIHWDLDGIRHEMSRTQHSVNVARSMLARDIACLQSLRATRAALLKDLDEQIEKESRYITSRTNWISEQEIFIAQYQLREREIVEAEHEEHKRQQQLEKDAQFPVAPCTPREPDETEKEYVNRLFPQPSSGAEIYLPVVRISGDPY